MAQEITEGRGAWWKGSVGVGRGNVGSDLRISLPSPGTGKTEVQATGTAGFQYFSTKDTTTDVLVWVDFARFFESEEKRVRPRACWPNRDSSFPGPGKITL